jgi:3,4-dihydroxy 2-butanone 4-phosphate synthase/GTP cyclohydrolase II
MNNQSFIQLPTGFGKFKIELLHNPHDAKNPHIVLTSVTKVSNCPLVRIHSECITGDLFSSLRCDCGDQLKKSLEIIGRHGGLLFYLRQEGRGIGIEDKLKAYALQDNGADTVSANLALGHQADLREYSSVVKYLKSINLNQIKLITNNPTKIEYLENNGIFIEERVPIVIEANEYNKSYILTKKNKMGHLY